MNKLNAVLFVVALSCFCVGSIPIDGNNVDTVDSIDSNDIIDISHLENVYRSPDYIETGKAVAEIDIDSNVNPEELGTYTEGDILFSNNVGRNGLRAKSSRWPNGIVPFVLSDNFNNQERAIIEDAIRKYHKLTCIRFRPRTTEQDYISFTKTATGCWSSVGKIGGKQEINLQSPSCLRKPGTILHELMHVLGFLHEQNRYERDSYVQIMFDNIQSNAKSNFDKVSASNIFAFGIPYDLGSVMHYSGTAFSANGNPTIIPKKPVSNMGQREDFSKSDIRKINLMYQCHKKLIDNSLTTTSDEDYGIIV